MARDHERSTGRKDEQAAEGRPIDGEGARERLLGALPVTERRHVLNGVSTAVLEGGSGQPIVLLHGPGAYGAAWLRVIPDLVKTHRVIAPDLPGHGASQAFDGAPDIDLVLGWLDDLIERACPTPPVLVGLTLGGAIAARFAARRGERIGELVLVDALGLQAFHPAPEFGEALERFISDPTPHTHDGLWKRCAFDLDALRGGLGAHWEWIKAYNLDRARAPGLKASQHGLFGLFGMPAIPPAELAGIAVPTTLIWGRHDLATPLRAAQAACVDHGWPLHVIENAADEPPMDQPEAFVAVLRSAIGDPARRTAGVPREPRAEAAWDAIAPAYDEFVTDSHMWLADEGLRRAGLRSGMSFVDVAAGSGALSIPAARHGARVLATDQSPVMLELLGARSRKEGLRIGTRAMDGHALDLEDDSFDMAGSQFGVMLLPDMPRALREMARVVRPGGRVLVHSYGDPRKIEFLGFLVNALRTVRPDFQGLPADPPPLPFQLQDPLRLRKELDAAGLEETRVETITETLRFPTGRSLWSWLVSSNPIVGTVLGGLGLTGDETEAVRRALEAMIRERAGGSGSATLTNPINIGIGTK